MKITKKHLYKEYVIKIIKYIKNKILEILL